MKKMQIPIRVKIKGQGTYVPPEKKAAGRKPEAKKRD